MMMSALGAGGMVLLTDGVRRADEHNPRGYFEHSAVLGLEDDSEWLKPHAGKVVKILSHLLGYVPVLEVSTKVLMMVRPLPEVVASQDTMLKLNSSSPEMARLMSRDFGQTLTWAKEQSHLDVLEVDYRAFIEQAEEQSRRVAAFLGKSLDIEAMVRVVDPKLYRQRVKDNLAPEAAD